MADSDDDYDDFLLYYSDDPDPEETTEQNENDRVSSCGEPDDTTEQNEGVTMLNFELLQQNLKFEDGTDVFWVYRAKIPGGWLVLMGRCDTEHFTPPRKNSYGIGWGYGGATFIPDPCHA